MLSRVADALYWMSRYIERAEDITRMLSVNFDAMLGSGLEDEQLGWLRLVGASADRTTFQRCFPHATAAAATEFLLWHPDNVNAVMACVTRARQNARMVREQISSEMWEHINRLYFLVKDVNRSEVLQGPYAFFARVRDGSQAFQGIAAATMTHGEPYEFIQLGRHIERASETVSTLHMKYVVVNTLKDGSPEANVQLVAMLKSCSAFEPFRRTYAAQLQAWRVAEYLLLSPEFPRAVRFCLAHGLESVNAISRAGTGDEAAPGARPAPRQLTGPQRAWGASVRSWSTWTSMTCWASRSTSTSISSSAASMPRARRWRGPSSARRSYFRSWTRAPPSSNNSSNNSAEGEEAAQKGPDARRRAEGRVRRTGWYAAASAKARQRRRWAFFSRRVGHATSHRARHPLQL